MRSEMVVDAVFMHTRMLSLTEKWVHLFAGIALTAILSSHSALSVYQTLNYYLKMLSWV